MLVRRGNNKLYFYRTHREAGRSVCRYVASGKDALNAAREAERQREARRDARDRAAAAWREERGRVEADDALFGEYHAWAEGLFLDVMGAAGYHRHKRTWRKRRMDAHERAAGETRLNEILGRIAAGDPGSMKTVTAAFDGAPDEMIKAYGGDLPGRVVEKVVERLAGTDLLAREAILRKVAKVQADLAGPDPDGVVATLAESAAVCWLQKSESDLHVQAAEEMGVGRDVEYFERRRDGAHRRFQAACRAVARARKLDLTKRWPAVGFGGRLAGVGGAGRN